MKNESNSIEDIRIIRKMMEESSRFLSLSGISGVLAGITAIAGAGAAYLFILDKGTIDPSAVLWQLIAVAAAVLVIAVLSALFLSIKKAKKDGKSIMSPVTSRLLINLLIPLAAGGVFAIVLLHNNYIQLIIPVLLIFYGLALVNAGKFTFGEIFYLGLLEVLTGLLAAFIPDWSLLFWIFGFGILHIIYGMAMYRKYEA